MEHRQTQFTPATCPSPLFIIGPAYSGKSNCAHQAVFADRSTTICGTADPKEDALRPRIQYLKDQRPSHWHHIEDNLNLSEKLHQLNYPCEQIIIDSLNQWVASRLLSGAHKYSLPQLQEIIETDYRQIIKSLREQSKQKRIVVVSSEISSGISPPHAVPRLYRELTSSINIQMAAFCKSVILMTAGIPLFIKP